MADQKGRGEKDGQRRSSRETKNFGACFFRAKTRRGTSGKEKNGRSARGTE